jgi:hypothetical protein
MSGTLLVQGDNIFRFGIVSPGTGSLAITFDDTGNLGNALDFLVLHSTTPVSIASNGVVGGDNALGQLEDTNNSLTKVTISGSEEFLLGGFTNNSNTGDGAVTDIAVTAKSPRTILSSLTLIDASATTGFVDIFAGATNTSGSGPFLDSGKLNANVTITYTRLTIENDAKNGIVTVATATTMRSPWADAVRRPWAPAPAISSTSGSVALEPMRRPVAVSAIL